MSDPATVVTDTSVPKSAPVPPIAAPAAPVAAAAAASPSSAAAASSTEQDPAWLPGRLDRTRKDLLKEVGAENVDDVKKALADFKAKQELDKTEAQRNGEKLAELTTAKARLAVLEEAAKANAGERLAALTDSQRSAVMSIAGDDPAAQLKTIAALSPTWVATPAPSTVLVDPKAAAEAASKLATTAPARTAPADATQTTLSPKETYTRLKSSNPFAASQFLLLHQKEIYPST